jgi:hypothetical protein
MRKENVGGHFAAAFPVDLFWLLLTPFYAPAMLKSLLSTDLKGLRSGEVMSVVHLNRRCQSTLTLVFVQLLSQPQYRQ